MWMCFCASVLPFQFNYLWLNVQNEMYCRFKSYAFSIANRRKKKEQANKQNYRKNNPYTKVYAVIWKHYNAQRLKKSFSVRHLTSYFHDKWKIFFFKPMTTKPNETKWEEKKPYQIETSTWISKIGCDLHSNLTNSINVSFENRINNTKKLRKKIKRYKKSVR